MKHNMILTELLCLVLIMPAYMNQIIEYGNWTWISGSNVTHEPGIYGVMGVPSPLNRPPARAKHAMVMDSTRGLIYIFGGFQVSVVPSNLISCRI